MAKTYRPSPNALLNPRMDSNFKALFTDNSRESRNALKCFLEVILNVEVSDIELRPNELAEEAETDKQSRFDISCTLNGTEAVNMELQGLDINACYAKRAEYYAAHLLNHYTPRGIEWQNVPKVFQISILNFVYDENSSEALTIYTMKAEDSRHLSDRMTIVFVELPKMISDDELNVDVEKLTPVQKWGKFLLYADREDMQDLIERLCQESGGIMDAHVTLAKISKDEAAWLRQTSQDIFERDVKSAILQGREQGIAEGRALGLAHGMAEGMKRGMAEGIAEGREKGLAEGVKRGKAEGIAEGREKGLAEGVKRGKAEGIAEGREKGMAEGMKRGMAEGIAEGAAAQKAEDEKIIKEKEAEIARLRALLAQK